MRDPWQTETYGSMTLGFADRLEWHDDALCQQVDPRIFHTERGEDGLLKSAKRVCNGSERSAPCPVRSKCLEWALETNDRFGVLGGLSPRQRSRLATERRREAGTLGQRTCQVCSALFAGGPGSRNCSTECGREARRRVRVQRSA